MSQQCYQPVMDVIPWPDGEGFHGADDWWGYIRNQSERDRLDFLLLAALTSPEIRHMLLTHDETLFAKFDLSEHTINILSKIQVNTLEAFAQALILSADEFS